MNHKWIPIVSYDWDTRKWAMDPFWPTILPLVPPLTAMIGPDLAWLLVIALEMCGTNPKTPS